MGLLLVAVAFFLIAVPSIIRLALGGPYIMFRFMEMGWTMYKAGEFMFFLSLFGDILRVIFAILVVAGLVKITSET